MVLVESKQPCLFCYALKKPSVETVFRFFSRMCATTKVWGGAVPTEIESISWYLADLNVDEVDYLAGMVATAITVLEHLDLPEYFSRFSNRIFGDRWKFRLLVLKKYLDVSYENLVRLLPSFRGVLNRVIGETTRLICGPDLVMAVDSTGFSESNASRHFMKRLKHFGTEDTIVRDFAKATFAADTGSLAIVSCDVADSHNMDVSRFAPVLELVKGPGVNVSKVVADKGCDSEQAHVDARGILGDCVETDSRPGGRRRNWPDKPGGRYRKSGSGG